MPELPSGNMEISSKELREVEFRERLRGYDTTEVDEFLERVAVALDELHVKLKQASDRASDRQAAQRDMPEDEDSVRRTLVLAQRAADMAIREANDEATGLVDSARSEAETLVSQAHESARRISSEAQRQLQEDVETLKSMRDDLRGDVRTLSDLLDNERQRLVEGLNGALKWVEGNLSISPEAEAHRAAPLSREGSDAADDLDQQLSEDAAAAQVLPPPPSRSRSKRGSVAAPLAEDDLDIDDSAPAPRSGGRPSGKGAGYGLLRESARVSAVNDVRGSSSTDRDTQAWKIEDSTDDWSA
jgi:cell division initiation protein